jgi:glycosyltransferase involved in cell wall biosynthesis
MFHLNSTDRVILAVGRNHPKKGYGDLIEAMALVKRKFEKAKCVIIGAGTENLAPMVKDLGLQGEVVLAGEIPTARGELLDLTALVLPHGDLVSAYLSSDIFVSPSLIEGFALVIPEALAAGLPVVATDVPGNRDAVVKGYNGLITNPRAPQDLAEKILVLLEDEDLRRRMSANARESSLRYDWGKITEEYMKVYEHLLAKVW